MKFKLPNTAVFKELVKEFPERFSVSKGITIDFKQYNKKGYEIVSDNAILNIKYNTLSDMMRAVGTILTFSEKGLNTKLKIVKAPSFDFRGLMIDVSRNGVLKIEFLKRLIKLLALSGINYLTLYTEDTFEVRKHPLIGYKRGKYSKQEIREIIKYAELFGMEIFPCIQTLGHLNQVLKFDKYNKIKESFHILNVEAKETYNFIDDLIKEGSEPYKSKLIHIGMDETPELGRGKSFKPNIKINPREIYINHLKKVVDICKKYKLKPIIWGDILAGMSGGTTDMNPITEAQRNKIPKDIIVDYWDYYNEDIRVYEKGIKLYHKMGFEPMLSPGVWTWNRLWANYGKVTKTMPLMMDAGKKYGIKKALMTMWGDGGFEAPVISSLPGLVLFAEYCYEDKVDENNVSKRFNALAKEEMHSYILPALLDFPYKKYLVQPANPSKCFLYDDPLFGLYSSHKGKKRLNSYYAEIRNKLNLIKNKTLPENKSLFDFAYCISDCLSLKADLWMDIYNAYNNGNNKKLKETASLIPDVLLKVKKLWKAHRIIWLEEKKVFGLEELDLRYGALIARLEITQQTLLDYINKKIDKIDELEEKPLNIFGRFPDIHSNHSAMQSISHT